MIVSKRLVDEELSKNSSLHFENGGPPANLLINQGVRDNVSGHTTRARINQHHCGIKGLQDQDENAHQNRDSFISSRKSDFF